MSSAAAPATEVSVSPEFEQPIQALRAIEANVARVIRGKPHTVRLALTTLLARGHLLIEDIPGVGKTTLARALAVSLGGTFRRIQFTSDLLPSDITGVSIFQNGDFEFRRGPIFANVVLADEINRTTPRTQSALLEAMSEGQVSVDDMTYQLEPPFLVLATQNPAEHFGTYPLPESQMDRFLMRIQIGYPSREVERDIIRTRGLTDPVDEIQPVLEAERVVAIQSHVDEIRVSDALIDYSLAVIEETRRAPALAVGVSTRGALAWYRAAQAYALISGRSYCVPDDFKELAAPVLAHRVMLAAAQESLGRARQESERAIAEALDRVAVPT